jgi:CrcB protein
VAEGSDRVRTVAVAAGGAAGTGLRYALAVTIPAGPGDVPVATLAANLTGALLLAYAVVRLVPRVRPRAAAFVTTGLLGALTTFSAFAVEAVVLARTRPAAALAYVALSLVAGPLAAGAGLRLAGRR